MIRRPPRSTLFPYTTLFRSPISTFIPGQGGQIYSPVAAFVSRASSPLVSLLALRCLGGTRSEEHTSELQSRLHLVCRLLLEKKKLRQSNEFYLTDFGIAIVC